MTALLRFTTPETGRALRRWVTRVLPTVLAAVIGLSATSTLVAQSQNGTGPNGRSEIAARANANPVDYTTARFERNAEATQTEQPITLDGRLDEPAWKLAKPATDFIQWEPKPGFPASDRTEVFFVYDSENLYVGAVCYDSHVDQIVVNELREDFQGQESDGFGFILDTLHDQRSGFFFGTNPAGAKRDLQVANDGDQANQDWDGVWDVKVTRATDRWVAEFVIPFKTLRFNSQEDQEWGLNMVRRIRRTNEDSHWSPIPRRYRVNRTSMAGTLRGLHGINPGRNFKIKPFVTGGVVQTRDSDNVLQRRFDKDGGVDIKYGLTQQLTLDATYRTDFSQVEVDQQQVNLTRFNIFFPEKRDFFLENSGLFAFGPGGFGGGGGGGGGGRGFGGANLVPFFSRRIGLSSEGNPIPIIGGARITGKVKTFDVGLIAMKTERKDATPSNTFLVGRFRKNYRNNSWIGALITDRESTAAGDYNRVYGSDVNLRLKENLEISSYLLRSDTPGKSGRNLAGLADVGWRDNDWSVSASHDFVQTNFNPEVGFIRRANAAHTQADASWRPRLRDSKVIRNFNFFSSADYFESSMTGKVETRMQNFNTGVFFQNTSNINFNVFRTFDRLSEPFDIRSDLEIPVGDYQYQRYSMGFNTDRSRAIAGNGFFSWGDFWNGRQTSFGGGLDLKPNFRLNVDLNYNRNDVKLPNGAFVTNLMSTRVLYAFSSRMFLNAFVQYNADTKQVSTNIRYQVIHHPLSDLFIVYNDRRDVHTGELRERALLFKFTNLFNF